MIDKKELLKNKVNKVLYILSDELELANSLLEEGEDTVNNFHDLTDRYVHLEDNYMLPSSTNGMDAFRNAVNVYNVLSQIMNFPNVMDSEIIEKCREDYILGLISAYKREKKSLTHKHQVRDKNGMGKKFTYTVTSIDFDKFEYHEMLLFSIDFRSKEWYKVVQYYEEALLTCDNKESMQEYIKYNYEAHHNTEKLKSLVDNYVKTKGRNLSDEQLKLLQTLYGVLLISKASTNLIESKNEFVKEQCQRIENQGFDFDTLLESANTYYNNHVIAKSKAR